jgi:probable HAF family extracellular repeat protein
MRFASTIGALCLAFSPQLLAEGYRFSTIDFPDSEWTELQGINARGVIVGYYGDSEGVQRAFRLHNGTFKTLDMGELADAPFANARGINARGDIVGNYDDRDGIGHGFLVSEGRFRRIDPSGAMLTILEEINNAGEIAGSWFDQDFNRTHFIRRGGRFLPLEFPADTDGVVRSLQDNGRVMVGYMTGPDFGATGFIRRKNGEFEVIPHPEDPAGGCAGFRSINQAGDIVGSFAVIGPDEECYPPFRESHGFLLRDGEFTYVDYPGIASTEPTGINDDGVVIGRYTDADGRVHGFKAVPK